MRPFDLHLPTRILFGPEQGAAFAAHVAGLSTRVFVLTGGGSVARLGYLDQVLALLAARKVTTHLFAGIEPNPQSVTINRAAAEAGTFGAGLILALGGGSVMDAAKAIAGLVACGETDIWEFVLGSPKRGRLNRALPVACIPTTAATASEVTPYAVISNAAVDGKAPLAGGQFKPVVSWLNPRFTLDLPLTVTRDGAADILSHVFENYLLGGDESPLADGYSEAVMRTVIQTLPRLTTDLRNEAFRGDLLWASCCALNGFQTAGRQPAAFAMHDIEHGMSGVNPALAHGRGLATLYPAYFRWMWDQDRARGRFMKLGQALFGTDDFLSAFNVWLKANGLWQSASAVGVPESRFGDVADHTVRVYGNGSQINALGPVTRDDIMTILRMTEAHT